MRSISAENFFSKLEMEEEQHFWVWGVLSEKVITVFCFVFLLALWGRRRLKIFFFRMLLLFFQELLLLFLLLQKPPESNFFVCDLVKHLRVFFKVIFTFLSFCNFFQWLKGKKEWKVQSALKNFFVLFLKKELWMSWFYLI